MWVECGVGMSVANDLATRNPEPRRGEAYTGLLCAVGFAYTLFIFYVILLIIYNAFLLILFTKYLYHKFKFFLPSIRKPPPRHGRRGGVGSVLFFNYSPVKNSAGSVA
jgi:hypothetical protein